MPTLSPGPVCYQLKGISKGRLEQEVALFADRIDVAIGYGFRISEVTTDIAFLYVDFDERTTRINDDNFNGNYTTEAVLLGLTVSW